jgi:hypothetical protein
MLATEEQQQIIMEKLQTVWGQKLQKQEFHEKERKTEKLILKSQFSHIK